MSQLIAMQVTDFVELLASAAPAPGGGSVAALAGAQAAALMAMVCRLTIGKKKYAEVETEAQAALDELEKLRADLLALVDADTEAYNAFGAALSLPKDTDEQQAARRTALQAAAKRATEVPARTLEAAYAVALILLRLYARTNRNCLSDAGTGLRLAQAAIAGAAWNIKINLPGTGDERFNQQQTARVAAIQAAIGPQIENAAQEIDRLLA